MSDPQTPRPPPASSPSRDDLLPAQPKGMRRGLALALIAHALLVIALAIGVNWRASEPVGVDAELWAAVPQLAAPAPAAPPPPTAAVEPLAPKPAPEPPRPKAIQPPPAPPEPRPEAQISVEREKEKLRKERLRKEEQQEELKELREKERREQDKKEQQRKREQQQAATEKALEEKKKKEAEQKLQRQQQEKEQALAQASLNAQREAQMKRIISQAGAAGGSNSTGSAQKSAGPSASYTGRIIGAIRPNIWFPSEVSSNPAAEVEVRVGPDGSILGRRLTHSSGIKEWDEAVLRAIDKTEKLPRDTDGRVVPQMTLVFRPKDLG